MTGLTNMSGLHEYPDNRGGCALMLKVTSRFVRHLSAGVYDSSRSLSLRLRCSEGGRPVSWMEFLASLVNSLAWPATLLVVAVLLRRPFARTLRTAVLRRLKAGPGGVELEWDRALEEAQTELAVEQLPAEAAASVESIGETENDFLDEMRQLARISPEAAVMESYRRVEQELRPLLEARVPPPSQRRRWSSLRALARQAVKSNALSPREVAVLNDLSALRNAAAHQRVELDEGRALAYADLAWDVLTTLVGRLSDGMEDPGFGS